MLTLRLPNTRKPLIHFAKSFDKPNMTTITRHAAFVDLSNFFNSLVRCGIDEPRELRNYFLHWLDFDLLAYAIVGEIVPVWVFYSGRRLGSKSERVENAYLAQYIERINRLEGVTAYNVEIPGEQREPVTFKCTKCNELNSAIWESEKGVDAALSVHLFDTADAWDHAILFSGDADFTPAVRSLRRKGKIISGAGISASHALVRELYNFVDLRNTYLRSDYAAYKIFGQDGLIENWLNQRGGSETQTRKHFKTKVEWIDKCRNLGMNYIQGKQLLVQQSTSILFQDEGATNLSEGETELRHFAKLFPEYSWEERHLLLTEQGWNSAKRHLPSLLKKYNGTMTDSAGQLSSSP